jgi:anhydro-N-acetylmuramic acid kinase
MMPRRLARLLALAEKPRRSILGLMSGTSLDGLDLALCTVEGGGAGTRVAVERFATRPYDADARRRLWEIVFNPKAPLERVCQAHAWLADLHGEMVLEALGEWGVAPGAVDVLASHGQTVFHAPAARATLQLGDGDRLAVRTGILTVSDFRQKELAGGGEGAPLAPYAESLLFRAEQPRVLLNIGGIANFTWLPALGDPAPILFGDTGPGNTLLDLAVRRYFPERKEGFDRGGELARQGRVHEGALRRLKQHPYLTRRCPKSTGPEEFGPGLLEDAIAVAKTERQDFSGHDALATLTRFTAETIADCLGREVPRLPSTEVVVSGGGGHNGTLMDHLARLLPGVKLSDSTTLGVPPDAKEAVLFAVLANETLAGPGFPARNRSGRPIAFGKLSFPD